MICEPNFNLPQPIDLKSMKKLHETDNNFIGSFEIDANVKPKASYHQQKEYNILPLFQDEFNHLNDILSLHSNDYLACRWDSFLDSVPATYVRIRLYTDYKKSIQSRKIRCK